ncbi:MAG TPA: type II CAAX endopeptidase family protein [Mycobacteriales bacterium]|jgi:membrane protease YdiL (CAAX protease family)|nr:type II CAAX endopeptidase family protein [Mycobacteriales bacterium]
MAAAWSPPQPAYAGWPAAATDEWQHANVPEPVDPDPGGRLLSTRALVIVAIAVLLGGALQIAARVLAHDNSITEDTLNNLDIVMTLSLYAVVAVLIVSQITPNVRLRWGDGPLPRRLAVGAMVGLGLSGVLLALVSAAAGHLDPDPRIVQLMNAGDPTHVIVMVALTVIAAPLVEETLFRGLLLESLRPYGVPTAVIASAAFFAVWHFLLASLVYYLAMGAGLGLLYLKRGMASSMAAHACFNGVLAMAAVIVVLGPSHTYDVDGLSMTAPSGWSQESGDLNNALHLDGPSGSEVVLDSIDNAQTFDPAATVARVQLQAASLIPGAMIDASKVREVELPAVGTAVEADFTQDADSGVMALFASDGRAYGIVFFNSGSAKAESDFLKMMDSLRPG